MLRTNKACQYQVPNFGKSKRHNILYTADKCTVERDQARYKLKVQNFSCHSLRKTFGRQVYNQNSENAELALVKLMELFNHSSVAITKRYLGLRQEEILQAYDSLSF